jgi:CheY-like chemotaxis protein
VLRIPARLDVSRRDSIRADHAPCHGRKQAIESSAMLLCFIPSATVLHLRAVALNGSSVLIVEDDPDLRHLFRISLALAGFHVREASDGYQALAALEDQMPAVVVLDLGLPRVSGFTVLEEIAAREDMRTLAVVVVTGLNISEQHDVMLLRKPVDPPVLIGAVRRALRRVAAET